MDMRMYSKWLAGNLVIYGGDAMLSGKGKEFFVDPANGLDTNDGLSWNGALKTILAAYNKCTDGANDKVIYLGGATGATLAATLTWAKSYTHLIGVCAPTRVAQRARIHNETVTGLTPLLNITGSGCVFKNFYIFQGVNEAVGNINVQVTGERNYFENVHFAGGGHAAQAIDGGASLKLDGGSENTFIGCRIGVDTIAAATGMVGLLVDGSATRNIFDSCDLTMLGGNAGAAFVEFTDITAIDRYLEFISCNFINLGVGQASAFVIPAGFDATNMRVLLRDPILIGATDWDAGNRGAIFSNAGTITGGGNSGFAIATVVA